MIGDGRLNCPFMHPPLFHPLCLSILFPVIVCWAELRLYEGFDYTVGEDQLAISGPWTGTGKRADIVDGNLIWQDALGNVLRCSGNRCLADAHQGTATLSNTRPEHAFHRR